MSLPHAAVTDAAEIKAIEAQIKEKEKAYKKETKAKKKGRTRESQRLQSEIDNLRAQIDGDEGIDEREAPLRLGQKRQTFHVLMSMPPARMMTLAPPIGRP